MSGRISTDFDVVIAGGGVGGAALALAFAQHGVRVLVLERRSGPGNINRGDSLLPTVTTHLGRWGALDRLREAGARAISQMEVHHPDRGLVMAAPLDGDPRHPYLVLPHPEIERVLIEAGRATGFVEVRHRARVARLLESQGRVCGVAMTSDSTGDVEIQARLVVGADGASSTVRAALGIPLPLRPYDHDYFVIDLARPAAYRDAMRIELHPDGGLLIVPGVDRVGVAVLVQARHESLFRAGSVDDKLAEIARRAPLLAGCAPGPGAHLYKLSRGHAPRYVARGAALLGDAVHVTNPTAGQGMTMAIEDAAALAAHLGPALIAGARGSALDGRLAAWEHDRRPKNAASIRWSHWMSHFYAFGGPVGDELRSRLFALGDSPIGRTVQKKIWTRMATRDAAPPPLATTRFAPHSSSENQVGGGHS